MFAAEKENEQIVVEIKSFLGASLVSEFHTAFGQFLNYKLGLSETKSERTLFLAISLAVYEKMQDLPIIIKAIEVYQIKLLIFSPQNKSMNLFKIDENIECVFRMGTYKVASIKPTITLTTKGTRIFTLFTRNTLCALCSTL